MWGSTIIFITSSHVYWRSPGRGSGFQATLLMWHMLSYEMTSFFQSSLVLCPNAATSQVKISKNTYTEPSGLCHDSKIAITLMTSLCVPGCKISGWALLIKWLPRLNMSSSTNTKPVPPWSTSAASTFHLYPYCLCSYLLFALINRLSNSIILSQKLWSTCITKEYGTLLLSALWQWFAHNTLPGSGWLGQAFT